MFGGKPLLAAMDVKYADYIDAIDEFYAREENRAVPLFYALQIADMRKKGMPGQQVLLYRMAVMQKLKDMGIVME